MIKILIAVTLSFFVLSGDPASAKSAYDNDIKNEIPLIGTITKSGKYVDKDYYTPSFLQDVYVGSDPSQQQYYNDLKNYDYNYDGGKRWAIMSTSNGNIKSPVYYLSRKDVKMRIAEFADRNYGFVHRWAFCNTSKTPQPFFRYKFLTSYTSTSFDGYTGLDKYYTMLYPSECYEIESNKSYINNFDVEYPAGYEGDKFYAELPSSSDKIKTPWRYGLARNKLWVKPSQPPQLSKDQFSKMTYNVDLFKLDGDNEVMLKSVTLPVSDTFFYDFDDQHEHTTYYIAVKLIKGGVDVSYTFDEVTRWFEYSGAGTIVSGSSGDFASPDVDTSKYKYEQCDALDIACHLRNVYTKITELFAGFFVPDPTILSDDFNGFVTFFKSKLGFLWQSVELVINSLNAMIAPPASCSLSVSGTGGGIVNRFDFNLCTLQARFPTLFDFGFLTLRGSIAFALVFAINNKLRGVLQS